MNILVYGLLAGLGLFGFIAIWFALFSNKKQKTSNQKYFKKSKKVFIEMVPKSMWGRNVRKRLTDEQWKQVCKVISKRAGYRCEVCGEKGTTQGFSHPVECHEVWTRNSHTQSLTGIQALCPMCHKARHIGLATKSGFYKRVESHMKKYNHMTENEIKEYIEQEKKDVKNIDKDYKLDLTYLNKREFSFLNIKFTNDENVPAATYDD